MMANPEEMDEETKAWLNAGLADLQMALDELEKDIPPEEIKAWLVSSKVVDEA